MNDMLTIKIDRETARIIYAGLHMLRTKKGNEYAIRSNSLPVDTFTNNIHRVEKVMNKLNLLPYIHNEMICKPDLCDHLLYEESKDDRYCSNCKHRVNPRIECFDRLEDLFDSYMEDDDYAR